MYWSVLLIHTGSTKGSQSLCYRCHNRWLSMCCSSSISCIGVSSELIKYLRYWSLPHMGAIGCVSLRECQFVIGCWLEELSCIMSMYISTWLCMYLLLIMQLPHIGVAVMVFLGLLLVGSCYLALAWVHHEHPHALAVDTWLFSFRLVIFIPEKWAFILTCVLLRVFEGVGSAFLTTAIFSTIPHLYPHAVATLVVNSYPASFCLFGWALDR